MLRVRRPVMGIWVESGRLNVRDLHLRQDRFLRTHRRAHGTVIAFSKRGIDWRTCRVKGYRFVPVAGRRGRGQGRWVKGWYPLPQAVFKDASKQGKVTLHRLYKRTGARLFNFVLTSSKYVSSRVLGTSSGLRAHLPETQYLTAEALAEYLSRYDSVYVKPDKGERGRGIYFVATRGSGLVVSHDGTRWTASADDLYPLLRRRIGTETYIVQQGIDLARHRGRKFDVRVMVQRGASPRWNCTGYVARVAGRGAVVTNLIRGHGRAIPVGIVLRRAGFPVDGTIDRMCEVATAAAETLDGRIGSFASLGFDIAVDRGGRIWIIEVNARAGHRLFDELENKAMYRRLNAFVYDHLRYLATHDVTDRLHGRFTVTPPAA